MKVRVKVKDISELKHGDEFLVGDGRWLWNDGNGGFIVGSGLYPAEDRIIAAKLIRDNVPIERELEAPEGYEIRQGDGEWIVPEGAKFWHRGEWLDYCGYAVWKSSKLITYAVPVEPPAFDIPKARTSFSGAAVLEGKDWDRVVAELKKHGAR